MELTPPFVLPPTSAGRSNVIQDDEEDDHVIVLSDDDDEDDNHGSRRRRLSSSDSTKPPRRTTTSSTNNSKKSEWAFLDSPSASSADDSDFESRGRKATAKKRSTPEKNKKPMNKKPLRETPKSSNAKAKKAGDKNKSYRCAQSEDDFDEDEEMEEHPRRREPVRHVLSDVLTVSELQAQEREFKRLQRLNQPKQHDATPAAKKEINGAAKKPTARPSPLPFASGGGGGGSGVIRPVLATTLAWRKHQRQDTTPSVAKKSKAVVVATTSRSAKRRLVESEEEDEEEDDDDEQEDEDDEDRDDFEVDIVAAKKAALRASLELTKSNSNGTSRGGKKSAPSPARPASSPATNNKSNKKKKAAAPVSAAKSRDPPKTYGKTKKPARKQPRYRSPSPPPSPDEPRESRRTGNLLSDWMSVGEMQAQEREWARLQREKKLASDGAAFSSPPAKSSSKPKDRSNGSRRRDSKTPSSRRERANSASSDDSALSMVEMVELIEDDDEDDVEEEEEEEEAENDSQDDDDDDYFVPVTPAKRIRSKSKNQRPTKTQTQNNSAKKKVPSKSKSKSKSRSRARTTSSSKPPAASRATTAPPPSAPRPTSNILSKPRTAVDTVPHWTTWRGIVCTTAPVNLLPLPSTLAQPFSSTADRTLTDYDASGDLVAKCQIVATFGKTKAFVLTNDAPNGDLSQDAMNERVQALLETWTPQIKACYERKGDAIIQEARTKTTEYLRLRDALFQSTVAAAVSRSHPQYQKLRNVCAAEHSLTQQLLVAKTVVPTKDSFTVSRGDTFLVEKKIVPHAAMELEPVRGLSRSTTFTGVKASTRVEDDPILRYVPYFGDNDKGDAIDVKHYDAVRAKEARDGVATSNGLDNEAHEFMLRLVVGECGDAESVFNALKQVAGFTQPYTEYGEIKKMRDSRRAASQRVQETREFMARAQKAGGGGVDEDASTREALQELTSTLFPFVNHAKQSDVTAFVPLAERFASQWTYFETNLLPPSSSKSSASSSSTVVAAALARGGAGGGGSSSSTSSSKRFRRLLGLRNTTDYTDLSETYRDLFCRMCYKYDCPDHGIEHPMPTRRVDPVYPTTRYAPVMENLEEPSTAATEDSRGPQATPSKSRDADVDDDDDQDDHGEDGNNGTTAPDARIETCDLASECSATTAESQQSQELVVDDSSLSAPRRSVRSGTRASTLATISVETQLVAQGFKPRAPRSKSVKTAPKRGNMDESEYLDDSYGPLVASKVMTYLHAKDACSGTCWKAPAPVADDSVTTDEFTEPEEDIKAKLTAPEVLLLQKLRYSVGENACMIASVLQSLSCRDVHIYLESQKRSHPVGQPGYFSPDVSSKKNRKRGRTTATLPTNNRELLKRTRHQRLKDTSSANHDYEPCNHEGICDFGASCSCMKRDHMCEKACSCSRDCPNRFQGCRCSMGNCRTNACPCFVAMRECNPDLCTTCGATDVPVLAYSNNDLQKLSAMDLGICCNVNVQRGLHKKIGVSFSVTHGWGSFALEPIKKGEFIYEYTGAIISHDEAERRGTIYDKLNISFLFDLNEDSVADAIRTGNKSKFCNHARVGEKCHARIMRAGGEHRISIWAKADIQKGEELFFNYGYHGESAPVWSQGARITETTKREAEAEAEAAQEEEQEEKEEEDDEGRGAQRG